MLLTKLIPPKSEQIKEALNVFNRFLEEPHDDLTERLEILLAGGVGSAKSSIAGGMLLKANVERGDTVLCLRNTKQTSIKHLIDQVEWCINKVGMPERGYSVSIPNRTIKMSNAQSKIYFKSLDEGCRTLEEQTRGIPNKRFVWIEDANQLCGEEEYIDLINSLKLRENPIIVLTYHPDINRNHWLNRYAQEIFKNNGSDNRWVFKPSCLDMDVDMLGKSFFKNMNYCRVNDERIFVSEYLGIPMEG